MPGCGGLRKLRIADPGRGKGKRGGARVIYLHTPEANVFFLITIYGKGEKGDLSAARRGCIGSSSSVLKRRARPLKGGGAGP